MKVWSAMISFAILVCASVGTAEQLSSDDEAWFRKHRKAVVDYFMPFDMAGVTFRSHHDYYYNAEERYFQIFEDSPSMSAVVVTPIGKSIKVQALDLRIADHQATLDDLLPQIKVDRTKIAEADCPQIRTRFHSLAGLPFSVPGRDRFMHPMTYEIQFSAMSGTLEARLYDQSHPLAQWALETLRELETCAKNQRGSTDVDPRSPVEPSR